MFCVGYLQPHQGPAPPLPPASLPLDDVTAGEYKVEDILESYIAHSGHEYLVKQLGYLAFESKWEPALYLANGPNTLYQFLSYKRWHYFQWGCSIMMYSDKS